jgi:Mn2+/Fe2+ NRAMP family transporter
MGSEEGRGVRSTAPTVTHEDLDRAIDRRSLERARSARGSLRWMRLVWLLVGPGILVMLGENDAPSMLSYSATGAEFGIGFFLPFVVLTFVMAIIVQEMTVRLGAISHRGHAELIMDRFGPFWGYLALGDLLLTNFLTLVTEFIGVRAGLSFFHIPPFVSVGGAVAVLVAVAMTGRYWTWERIMLGLALFNGFFLVVALLVHPDWGAIGHAFLTWGPLPRLNGNMVLLLVSDIGATVTPWMLFFQQGAVVDKGLTGRDVTGGRLDTILGGFLAALFGCGAIVAASPLFLHGISATNYQAADFAQALVPYAGRIGATLFALGIFEAGMVAAITISTSSAYSLAEFTGAPHSLNRPLREAWPFYLTLLLGAGLAGGLVVLPGVPLEFVVLIVNVIAVLTMPPALILLLLLANDGEVMGEFRNGPWQNVLTVTVTAFLTAAGLLFALSILFPKLL